MLHNAGTVLFSNVEHVFVFVQSYHISRAASFFLNSQIKSVGITRSQSPIAASLTQSADTIISPATLDLFQVAMTELLNPDKPALHESGTEAREGPMEVATRRDGYGQIPPWPRNMVSGILGPLLGLRSQRLASTKLCRRSWTILDDHFFIFGIRKSSVSLEAHEASEDHWQGGPVSPMLI